MLAQLRDEGRAIGGHIGLLETRERAWREQLFGNRAAEQMVHAGQRIAHRHRHERVAVVGAAQREYARAPRNAP